MELRRLIALLALSALPVAADEARPEKVVELPGIRAVLPPGDVVQAAVTRTERTLRVALATVASDGKVRLLVARQRGKTMQRELLREQKASGVLGLTLDPLGPQGRPVAAVHWAQGPSPHEGKLEVWLLGGAEPCEAYAGRVDGYYFKDLDGSGRARLVAYEVEQGSAVLLPRVYGWTGEQLQPAPEGEAELAGSLLADYEEVLAGFRAAGPDAEPTAMVADVALLKGRLLERLGRTREAAEAYGLVSQLTREGKAATQELEEERRLVRERAAEARRRAKALAGR